MVPRSTWEVAAIAGFTCSFAIDLLQFRQIIDKALTLSVGRG